MTSQRERTGTRNTVWKQRRQFSATDQPMCGLGANTTNSPHPGPQRWWRLACAALPARGAVVCAGGGASCGGADGGRWRYAPYCLRDPVPEKQLPAWVKPQGRDTQR